MTEPTNPTPPEEETVEVVEEQEAATAEEAVIDETVAETVVEEEKPVLEAVSEASTPEVVEQVEETVEVAAVETGSDVAFVEDDDDDEDAVMEDEGEESKPRYVEGPADYVQRERRGRGRRIGSDVRIEDVNYKNTVLLTRFLDPRGRVLSRRKTRVSAKVQRRVVKAIKRARHLALLPYTANQTRTVRKRR